MGAYKEVAYPTEVAVKLRPVTCCACFVAFGISARQYEELVSTHQAFYCPAGHRQNFIGESDIEKLRKELAAETKRKESAIQREKWALEEAKQAELKRRAAVGQSTKLRNRVGNGVCPCCNRTFANLQKHMCSKHPEFTKDD